MSAHITGQAILVLITPRRPLQLSSPPPPSSHHYQFHNHHYYQRCHHKNHLHHQHRYHLHLTISLSYLLPSSYVQILVIITIVISITTMHAILVSSRPRLNIVSAYPLEPNESSSIVFTHVSLHHIALSGCVPASNNVYTVQQHDQYVERNNFIDQFY